MRGASLLLGVLALFATVSIAEAADAPKVDKIVVEKANHTLTLYSHGQAVKTYRVAIGVGAPGQKIGGGDDRTPEGTYIIDSKNPKSDFNRALHISYPNAADRERAREHGMRAGGLIAIHGTPDWIERIQDAGEHPDWTAGCIAVRNTEIKEIYALVPVGTPIEIKP
ncbi:MAG: L,D-transpeptidase family protein [Alphaproteobacteria bacterium]|nr:L,D-transpeptidase family protein [Alphaproteobacteria bacterium]